MDEQGPTHHGKLIAWDPVSQREVWSVEQKSPWNAGVLATAELVFQGDAEGKFKAFNAETGEEVWSYNVGSGVIAPPVTYKVDGVQYITLVAGWGGVLGRSFRFTDQFYPGTVYTFRIDGDTAPPVFEEIVYERIDLDHGASSGEIKTGMYRYNQHCARCHGSPGDGGGAIPDLTYSSEAVYTSFHSIVSEGAFLEKGMPVFKDRLKDDEISNIKSYLLHTARELREAEDNQGAQNMSH